MRRINSSRAVSEPGMPIAHRVYTRTPLKGVETLQYFIDFFANEFDKKQW